MDFNAERVEAFYKTSWIIQNISHSRAIRQNRARKYSVPILIFHSALESYKIKTNSRHSNWSEPNFFSITSHINQCYEK